MASTYKRTSQKKNRSLGILNRLKHYLPLNIKNLMYNSLVLSHLNYGILLWGFTDERIFKLQKKVLRVISLNKYNAHTDPIFKNLNILKLNDIFVTDYINIDCQRQWAKCNRKPVAPPGVKV